jgi:hypothetical protein
VGAAAVIGGIPPRNAVLTLNPAHAITTTEMQAGVIIQGYAITGTIRPATKNRKPAKFNPTKQIVRVSTMGVNGQVIVINLNIGMDMRNRARKTAPCFVCNEQVSKFASCRRHTKFQRGNFFKV